MATAHGRGGAGRVRGDKLGVLVNIGARVRHRRPRSGAALAHGAGVRRLHSVAGALWRLAGIAWPPT